ncbi:hypothetical protein MMF94_34945, partial [Pseudonocardia alaniniphila]
MTITLNPSFDFHVTQHGTRTHSTTATLNPAFPIALRRSRPVEWCSSVRVRLCGSDHAVISS